MDNKYFSLPNRIAFYVPSTKEGSKKTSKIEFAERTQEVTKLLCKWYGGASVQQVTGSYLLENGILVTETVNKVLAFATDEAYSSNSVNLIQLASKKCKEWTQETIGLETNGTFYLID